MTLRTNKKITILIPCYNEEGGIGDVIKGFDKNYIKSQGYDLDVIVIDNNSKDRTGEIARELGATVIVEKQKGKGNAMRTGFKSIPSDTDYVVMLDGDNSYKPQELLRLIEPLNSGFCRVVVGSRLTGRIMPGSMTTLNRAGNWVFSHLVKYLYMANVTDVLTGYFAWKREVIEDLHLHLESDGFAIEMEMITKMSKLGEEIYSVPISYEAREGESNLRPFYDGSRILAMLVRNLFWKPAKMKIKKIAFVSDAVLPFHIGGKEKRLYEVSTRMVSDSYEVHIYTMKWWAGPKIINIDGVYYHAISKLRPLYTKNGRRSISEAVFFGLATFKLLFQRFDVLEVDTIPFFPLFSGRIVAWLHGKKMYATWYEVWGYEYWIGYLGGLSGVFGYIIERLAFYMPDVIISISVHTTKKLRLAGVKKEIKTIPLGVDVEKVYNSQPMMKKSDVIFVGRLLENKRVDVLIEAIAQVKKVMPTVLCKIIGNGPEKNNCERLIRDLALEDNIEMLTGIDEQSEIYGLMKSSKMLVLPSVREGFGLVVLEANAAGIPVITTNHKDNAAKDLINEGVNGFAVNPDSSSVAEKIIEVLEIRHTMEPRAEINNYDWETVVNSLKEVTA